MAEASPSPSATSVTLDLYRAAIGPRGQESYLRQFMRFEAAGRAGPSWNWAASACTLNWLLWRRMPGRARRYLMALALGAALLPGAGDLVFHYSAEVLRSLSGLLAAAFLLPGLYGNAWYYEDCQVRIDQALRGTLTERAACELLAHQAEAPRSRWRFVLANGVWLVLLAVSAQWLRDLPAPSVADALPQAAPMLAPSPPASAPAESSPAESASVAPASSPVAVPAPAIPASDVSASLPTVQPAASQVPAAATTAAPASAVPREKASTPHAAGKAWYVAVGAFAQADNANRLREQLQAAGYRVRAEPWPPQPGRLTAVRVGPFGSRAEAEQAADGLKARDLPAVLQYR